MVARRARLRITSSKVLQQGDSAVRVVLSEIFNGKLAGQVYTLSKSLKDMQFFEKNHLVQAPIVLVTKKQGGRSSFERAPEDYERLFRAYVEQNDERDVVFLECKRTGRVGPSEGVTTVYSSHQEAREYKHCNST